MPQILKSRFDILRQDKFLKNIRLNILDYFKEFPPSPENHQILEVISFLKKNPLHMFPYDFIHKYDSKGILVYEDQESAYKYVIDKDKRLYYPLGWSSENISTLHSFSCLEQDNESPHSYMHHLHLFTTKMTSLWMPVQLKETFLFQLLIKLKNSTFLSVQRAGLVLAEIFRALA